MKRGIWDLYVHMRAFEVLGIPCIDRRMVSWHGGDIDGL